MISNNEVDVDDSSEIPNQSENPSGANASTTVVIAQNSDDQSNTENSVQQQETQQIQTISASDSGSSQSTSQNASQNWRSQTTQNVSRQQPVNSTWKLFCHIDIEQTDDDTLQYFFFFFYYRALNHKHLQMHSNNNRIWLSIMKNLVQVCNNCETLLLCFKRIELTV